MTRLPWSHHQLIVPDPSVPTHVCLLASLSNFLRLTECPESRVRRTSKHTALPLRASRNLCLAFGDRSPIAYHLWSPLPTGYGYRAAKSQFPAVPDSAQGFCFAYWNPHGASALFFGPTPAGRADDVV